MSKLSMKAGRPFGENWNCGRLRKCLPIKQLLSLKDNVRIQEHIK